MSMRGMGSAMRTAVQGRTPAHCAKSPLKQAATGAPQTSGSAKAQAQKAAKAARHAATCPSDGAVYLRMHTHARTHANQEQRNSDKRS